MFTVRRDEEVPGFSVQPPQGPPWFRMGSGAPPPAWASQSMPVSIPQYPNGGGTLVQGDVPVQGGGSLAPEAPMEHLNRFAGNPYWIGDTADRSVGVVTPVGFGFPSAPAARLPRVEAMQPDEGPFGFKPPTEAWLRDVPNSPPPGAGSPDPLVLAQYNPDGGPLLPSTRRSPETDSSPGEVVVLPDGSTIGDPKSPTGNVMSPKADLHDVAAKGRQIGETFRATLANPETSAGAAAYLYTALGLAAGQGGTYDHQRRGNMIAGYTQLPQFRPIANVNVGLLGQQAGLTLEEILGIAGTYARLRSSNADEGGLYGLDPRTLHYITRGYEIGQSGLFDQPSSR